MVLVLISTLQQQYDEALLSRAFSDALQWSINRCCLAHRTHPARTEPRRNVSLLVNCTAVYTQMFVYSWTRLLPARYFAHLLLLYLSGVRTPHSMCGEESGGGGPVVVVVDVALTCCTVRVLGAADMGKRAHLRQCCPRIAMGLFRPQIGHDGYCRWISGERDRES